MTDATALEAALDQMYHCILAADFGDLTKIVLETEQLVGRLNALPDKSVAERLRRKAHRNGLCLQAAARGLRAAQRRLGEMTNASGRLSTYTSGGQRAEVATAPGTLAQRL
jgi:hypothetical protein